MGMGRYSRWIWIVPVVAVAVLWVGRSGSEAPAANPASAAPMESKVVLSPVYNVDRKYRSMMGPYDQQEVYLLDSEAPPELLWITGYRAVMVDGSGETAMPQEFMCHSNLDLNVGAHREALGANASFSSRLFTLSQGQLEIEFPLGFGIPILSSEPLSLTTQVLNLNHEGEPIEVRHRVSLHYVRDSDVDAPMQALFPIGAYGLALLEGDSAYYGISKPETDHHGPGCMIGSNASDHTYEDPLGRSFTGHWVVKPGREVNRTLVTKLMRVPYDTEIHYIAVHLHPYAESLELRDLTSGETIFHSRARGFEDRIGLSAVESFSSIEGVPVYEDHEYELVSVYNNTTDEEQDSMAVMYIYLKDRDFDRREARQAIAGSAPDAEPASS